MNAQKTLPPLNLRTLEMYLAAIILGAAAGWGYWWTSQQPYPPEDLIPVQSLELSDAIAKLKSSLPPELAAVLTVQPQTYWVSVINQQETLLPQPLTLDVQASPEERLTTAMETLLTGLVKIDDAFTVIPKGTQLRSLSINDGDIYIDLSQEFAGGGGSSSMIYRVAQVIYTSTSLDPDAAVYLSVGGRMISDTYPLGGEGLVLEQPVTRETFRLL
ncbi:MAG: GerMN domain-containing protein [Leptolyngbyaceae cyanobacterium]